MRHHLLSALILIAFGLTFAPAIAVELSVGVARVDLTPPPEMKAVLGGYGERMSRPAEGVHDRIFAKAIVLADGDRRYAILTADILGFPPAFKPALLEQLKGDRWTTGQIMLLPSHSHTSIEMNAINPRNVFGNKAIGVHDEELFQWTLARCRSVIQEAANDLAPAEIGVLATEIDGWNRNRRHRGGRTDNTLTVTRIDSPDGAPRAVLVNFTAHPTFMGAKHMLFSGGWPGHLQRTLEAMIGGGVTVLFYNGAEGDQSPVGRPNSGSSRWEAAGQYGLSLAIEAHDLWTTITPRPDVEFDFQSQSIDLPKNRWHPEFMKTGGDEYGLSESLLEKILPAMFPRTTASGSLRLGDLVIVGVPGEMQAHLGIEIKSRVKKLTGAKYITIGGLADEWISYILSADEYNRGGYEASVSFYGETLGQCVVDGAVASAEKLK